MKLVEFKDPRGDPVLVNIELIRVIDGDTDNTGPLTDIAFDGSHTVSVRGTLEDTVAAIRAALKEG
jgi:hypothetical protein